MIHTVPQRKRLATLLAFSKSLLQTIAANKAAAPTDAEAVKAELSADGALVSLLAAGHGAPRISDVVRQISLVRSAITISSLSVDRQGTSSIVAVLGGVALTRDELISFRGRLENLAPGASVDLPIDELAKSPDIDVSIRFAARLP